MDVLFNMSEGKICLITLEKMVSNVLNELEYTENLVFTKSQPAYINTM